MTQAGNIQVQTSFKADRRDPHLRNGPKSTDFRFNPFQDEAFIKNNEIMAGLALGELEMWIHRFIGMPSQIKEFEDIGTWCNKSNARVYFMNLIFYNYFSGLVTTKSIVSNQIMITRKAASDMVASAIKLGIVEYYSDKEFRATERYIEYYLKYTKLVAKTYIPKLTKLLTQLHAINNVPNAQETFKIRG
jgi:hypothetical protein